MRPRLSVIVPMYNEARRVGPTIADVLSTLAGWEFTSELLLVDDGSVDETARVVQSSLRTSLRAGQLTTRLLRHDRNRGKGAAVRTGLAASAGEWRLIMDADNSSRVREVLRLFERTGAGVGLVAGSREAPGSKVRARLHRKLAGGTFRMVLRALGLNLLRDTQCGFKLYREDVAAQVVAHGREDRYAFDLEHLLIARATDLRIEEVPVEWAHCDGGHVSPLIDGMKMVREALRIRRRWISERPSVAKLPSVLGGIGSVIEAKPAAPVQV